MDNKRYDLNNVLVTGASGSIGKDAAKIGQLPEKKISNNNNCFGNNIVCFDIINFSGNLNNSINRPEKSKLPTFK